MSAPPPPELVISLSFELARTRGSAGSAPDVAASGHTAGGDVDGEFCLGTPKQTCGWWGYATLTFRDPGEEQRQRSPTWTKPGWGYAHKGLREFNKGLMGVQFGDSQPYWIACMEYQKHRGVPHRHLLMGGLGDECRMDWADWWYERYGITRIEPYNAELGARYYLGKYLTKEVADVQYSPQLRANHRRVVARSHQVVG